MSLSSLERRVSPENPSTSLSNPAAWLSEALGSAPTTSGIAVNESTAMRYAACYACINARAKDVAQLPVFVYERTGKDERTPARKHPAWKVMHDRPNPMMTPMTFKQTIEAHVAGWGNGYAEIEFDNAGQVRNLWPLLPDRTRVVVRDGEKWVVTRVNDKAGTFDSKDPAATTATNGAGKWIGLPSDRVLHVPGLGFDGLKGYSVIGMARNAIGAGMAAEEFSARLFANGATPRFALKHPKTLSNDAREKLRLDFTAAYSGLSNAHRTAVLEEGLEIQTLGLPAKDAEMIETSKFGIEQMARFFDMPLVRLHSTAGITSWGTGLEQWHRAYLIHTIGPCLVQWEESASWSLFSENERADYFVEFLREAFLQGDMAAQGAFFRDLFNIGGISPNEISRKMNRPTVGPEGDQRFVPLNMIPLQEASVAGPRYPDPSPKPAPPVSGPDDPPADDATNGASMRPSLRQQRSITTRQRTQDAYRRIYRQVADRVIGKQVNATRRSVERLGKDNNLAAFQQWVREFFDGERTAMADAYLPATTGLGELVAAEVVTELGSSMPTTQMAERFAALYVDALAAREASSSTGQLLAIAAEGSTADGTVVEKLLARLDGWDATRAGQIAMREPIQAGNAVARHVYEQAGVQRLMWVAMGSNTCELCQAMDGRIVSISRPFLSDGESVENGDKAITAEGTISHPPLHKGCSCGIVADSSAARATPAPERTAPSPASAQDRVINLMLPPQAKKRRIKFVFGENGAVTGAETVDEND